MVMPDLMRIGGVTGWMRAVAIAEQYSMAVSSHLMPEISSHLMLATPNRGWLEWTDWLEPILKDPAVKGPPSRGLILVNLVKRLLSKVVRSASAERAHVTGADIALIRVVSGLKVPRVPLDGQYWPFGALCGCCSRRRPQPNHLTLSQLP